MNKNYVIAFVSKDKDIILEPLVKFDGDTLYFKTEYAAIEYISRLYINADLDEIEPMSEDDGLTVIRVQ